MTQTQTLQILQKYQTTFDAEEEFRLRTMAFVAQNDNFYLRSNLSGHLTASAWIMNSAATHAVLIHHKKLNRWFQPGGHIEADETDLLAAARREGKEECGFETLTAAQNGDIFDIDIHTIPAKKDVPEHLHYDIRFVFVADERAESNPDWNEVSGMKWVSLEVLLSGDFPASISRMAEKMAAMKEK